MSEIAREFITINALEATQGGLQARGGKSSLKGPALWLNLKLPPEIFSKLKIGMEYTLVLSSIDPENLNIPGLVERKDQNDGQRESDQPGAGTADGAASST